MTLHDDALAWASGWTAARQGAVTQLADGALDARIDSVLRTREIVLVNPTVGQVDSYLGWVDPDTWLTIIGDAPTVSRPANVEVYSDQEALMRIDPLPAAHADSESVEVEFDHGIVTASAHASDGALAASGTAAVSGDYAIFDRITTEPEYRRRGYGSIVMNALTAACLARGSSVGILAASVDGQHLYRRLGWQVEAAMLTYHYLET